MKQKTYFSLVMVIILVLSSCIGISSTITLNRDGSGTMLLIYRIPQTLESLGKLDGNERWLPIPVGKADFERTLDRLPGMSLGSFSSKKDGTDLIIQIGLEFDHIDALTRFLDATGQEAALVQEKGVNRLSLTLSGGISDPDPELVSLVSLLAGGYEVELSFTLPEEGAITLYSGKGVPLDSFPGGNITARGKELSFKAPMVEVLSSSEGLRLEIRW
ncbi:MAG: hypothetical protein LBT93_03300 [Treponema sp.]|jgi:hypothetical protein|nr:hypothetical protein [Treponema sp.]